MSPALHIICSFALTHGTLAALAANELRQLRRPRRGGKPDGDIEAGPPAPQKPLPDCLIPRPAPRELELA